MSYAGDILVVEDHHDIAEMVCEHLEGCGYSVDYAGDGHAGLRLGCDNTYDAVVLDLMLPGMDGPTAAPTTTWSNRSTSRSSKRACAC